MSLQPRSLPAILLALATMTLAGCGPDAPSEAAADALRSGLVAGAQAASAWRSAPVEGVELRGGGVRADGEIVVATGPHTVLWLAGAQPLEPPYTVRALLHKRSGRIHEGYGLVFGGERLDRAEAEQAYSYLLICGDGSFLIRRREGVSLPILRAWTSDRAIRRDLDDAGQPNEVEVAVGREEVVFRVNGSEVARLPTAELRVSGVPGLRVAHDVTLQIGHFSATAWAGDARGG